MANKRKRGSSIRRRVGRVEVAPVAVHSKGDLRFEHVTVTPDMATRWLEGMVHNREVSDLHVERLARDMRAGHWLRSGDTIKFNTAGKLIDGQHRLWAIVYAGVTIGMDVVRNVPDEALLTIDTNRLRTFANHIQITHEGTKYTQDIAATTRWWLWYETLSDSGMPVMAYNTMRATYHELDDCWRRHPEITEAVNTVRGSKASRVLPTSVAAFVLSGALTHNEPQARVWIEQVAKGVNIGADSPTYRLRERFMNARTERKRVRAEEAAAITMKSWLAFQAGRSVKSLRFIESEAFPTFGGARNAQPKAHHPRSRGD